MGIQINGQTDTVTSTTSGGSVTVTPANFPSVSNLNATGIVTTTRLNVGTGGTVITTTTSGRMGVGKVTPLYKLEVAANPSIEPAGNIANFTNDTNADFTITCGASGITTVGPVYGVLALRSSNSERLRIDSSGNVGIGTASPLEKTHIYGSGDIKLQVETGSSGVGANSALTLKTASEGTYLFQTGNAVSGGLRIYDGVVGAERLRITSDGSYTITQTPGKYTADTSAGATTIANGGTVDFPAASGMLVVNNWTNGNVTIYICGGGTVTTVANTGSAVGSFAYNAGIAGYRWTNNYGSAAVFGFFFVRTRTTA